MTENRGLTFRGAFLHDTQTADLCREQMLLEQAFARLETAPHPTASSTFPTEPPLPFRFPLPCCPIPADSPTVLAPETPKPGYRLELLAPIVSGGWIIRPVRPRIEGVESRASKAESTIDDSRSQNVLPLQVSHSGLSASPDLPPMPDLPPLSGFPGWPGFPAGPAEAGFLLGWWGERAQEILERARVLSGADESGSGQSGADRSGSENILFRDFSVRVWYHAEIRLTLSAKTPGFRSVSWQTGKPSWIKAAR